MPSHGSQWSLRRSAHPHQRIIRLLPREEQELELNNLDLGLMGEHLNTQPPWEGELVNRIRDMVVTEQGRALDTIYNCLKDNSQHSEKKRVSEMNESMQKLLQFFSLDPQKSAKKTFLFHLYGLILRECSSKEQVERHLTSLLELSHQHASQREGIAFAVGLTSTKHLEEVWALLEHLGRTKFLRSVLMSPESQSAGPDPHWKWVSSTSLLCYGQMATHTKEQILPWVDNIASRMVYYFTCSPLDDVLKSSFLSAVILLARALRQEYGAQRYKFTQTSELIHCLLSILQQEPNFLTTRLQQKIILVIAGLSNLRPSLKPLVKSKVLEVCLYSVYTLPSPEALQSRPPPSESSLDIMVLYRKTMHALNLLLQNFVSENPSMDEVCFLLQHMEIWLKSDKSYERKRVMQSVLLLLQYVVDSLKLAEEAVPSMLGHHIGLLTLLWWDKDETTRKCSHQCVFLLLQLVVQQKGKLIESLHWAKMKQCEDKAPRHWEMKLYYMVKAFKEDLTVAQHTQLVLTLLCSLCTQNYSRCDLAAKFLLMICEGPGVRKEQVTEILHCLFQELPRIYFKNIQQAMRKAAAALGMQHSQEVVEVVLSLCQPSERQILLLWKALGANHQLARDVITELYMKLKLRPARELIQPPHQAQLVSLTALNTIYELIYMSEYRATVRWAFAGILLGLLTELSFVFELGLMEDILNYQEDSLDSKPLGPCRTCLEALKGLFWTTHYWEVFAHIKLLKAWEFFEHWETYSKGVILLARAMAHYNCEVKAVLGQAVIFLKSAEERDNIAAILIISEFLNSPGISQHVSRKAMVSSLNLGLHNPNPLVQAMSLKGFSSILMHPNKVNLLQDQLLGLLDSFLQPECKDPVGLMKILGSLLYLLGAHSSGAIRLKIAFHLLSLFKDDRAEVREGAIFLFGDIIHSGNKKFRLLLRNLASQAVAPLLFHMADPSPKVVTKAKLTFLRCAILLKWEFQKELFSKLAWGRGLGAENDIFVYMVESNFGNYQQFLKQALTYLNSPHKSLKLAAMKFIGGLLQDYFNDLCFYLKKGDVKTLKNHLETLSQDSDSTSRRFYLNSLEDVIELSHYVT